MWTWKEKTSNFFLNEDKEEKKIPLREFDNCNLTNV
jgi:hypothetical protein